MLTAKARGAATVTVTADDDNGGTAQDRFTTRVKAAMRRGVVDQPPDPRLVVRNRPRRQRLTPGRHRTGVMLALSDVHTDEHPGSGHRTLTHQLVLSSRS